VIGVIVPANDEEELIDACLDALCRACRHPGLANEPVRIVVVLDHCRDGSAAVVGRWLRRHPERITMLEIDARNVGAARNAGAAQLIEAGARWLAFTDADSRVAATWLTQQLSLNSDAVCGSIAVEDWSGFSDAVRQRFHERYQDREHHRHVHGANLGVATLAYLRAGGFLPLRVSEDVALVKALVASGATVAWSALPRVFTSARRSSRTRGGFADHLLGLERLLLMADGC
jgi:glycosyltransferase involved in cell wall biosynthesis